MNKRYWMMLRLFFIHSPMKRARYMKEKGVFKNCGDNVMITSRKIPLYSNLISIGNNVWIASNVTFITHDVAHYMLNVWKQKNEPQFEEKIGCIKLGDNIFIGANTQILYDVHIGSNVIVAAGSLINKDVPDNSVVGGVPARVIGTFDEFVEKRKSKCFKHLPNNAKQSISAECEEEQWLYFEQKRI